MEELIRAAAEGKTDSQPETIIAMLQARIGRLPAGPRRTVLAASVFGQTLWEAGVVRLLGLPAHDTQVELWLQVLIDGEMIETHGTSRIPEQREYGFRHALVRDAAYALLTEQDKKVGHQVAAEFLATTDSQVPDAILAHHFRQAGLLPQAIQHYLRAGDRASQITLYEEARLHYAAAEETIAPIPSTPLVRRQHCDILLKRVESGMTQLAPASQLQLLEQARGLVQSLLDSADAEREDRRRLARVDFFCARIYNYAGQPERSIPYFQRVHPVAEEFADHELLALSSLILGFAELTRGQMGRANHKFKPVLARRDWGAGWMSRGG